MNRNRAMEISAVYAMIEEADPDISTEQLLARTADAFGIDASDVVEALQIVGQ